MNKIKYILLSLFILLSTTSFAAWSQPTAVPPQGNTEPPINISGLRQRKVGVIEAYGFCIIKPDGTRDCLGSSSTINNPPIPTTSFPWIFDGNNIKNTNEDDNVLIDKTKINSNWGTAYEKLTVGGKVKAEGFCLGNQCVNSDGTVNTITENNNTAWTEVIRKLLESGAGVSKIKAGTGVTISPTIGTGEVTISSTGGNVTINNISNPSNKLSGTTNRIVKFTGAKDVGDSSLTDNGTLITNSIPVSATGGFILENREDDGVPPNQIGRIWIRSDI